MRAKLALLAAAAVVFAPAWGGTGTAEDVASRSSLAARILAPAVEEGQGASHAVGRATLQQMDRVKQRASSKSLAGLLLAFDRIPIPTFWFLNLAVALIGAAAIFIASGSPRAPPRLLAL